MWRNRIPHPLGEGAAASRQRIRREMAMYVQTPIFHIIMGPRNETLIYQRFMTDPVDLVYKYPRWEKPFNKGLSYIF